MLQILTDPKRHLDTPEAKPATKDFNALQILTDPKRHLDATPYSIA